MNSQERYQEYLKSDYWKEVSYQVKKRAGFRCQLCNSQLDLIAHHRCYDHRGDELNHLEDLTCICQRCHSAIHLKDEQSNKRQPPVVVQGNQPKCGSNAEKRRAKAERRAQRDAAKVANYAARIQAIRDLPPKKQIKVSELKMRVPPGDLIKLERFHINGFRTERGAFTKKTVEALGLNWSALKSGWVYRLVGTEITRGNFLEALIGSYKQELYEIIYD